MRTGDYGAAVTITVTSGGVAWDISAATTKEFKFRRPDGSVTTVTAVFVGTGSDGKLSYTVPSGFLNMQGVWKVQALITFASSYYQTAPGQFVVEANL